VAYGGGGPLHATAIARELGIPRVVVPPSPSTFSAWGMLATDLRQDLVRTVLEPLEATDAAWAEARYAEMQQEIEASLPSVGTPLMRRAADLRYVGQEHTVTVSLASPEDWPRLRREFDLAHERAYGYAAPDVAVQLINVRLTVVCPLDRPRLSPVGPRIDGGLPFGRRPIYSTVAQESVDYRVFERDRLAAGDRIDGPAAIEEAGTTTIVEPGDVLRVDDHGALVIEVRSHAA
jgi:N-methylhydantoinase A